MATVKLSKQANPMTPTMTLRQLLPITKKSLTANNDRYDMYNKKSNMRKTNESLRGSMHADKKALKLQRQRQKTMGASHQEYDVELRQTSHHPLFDASSSHESLVRTPEAQKEADVDSRNTWTRSTRTGVDARAIPN